MKNIILLFGVFTILACKNPKREIKDTILYHDSVGYWNHEWPRDRAEFYGATLKFDKKGKIVHYSFNKIKNRRRIFGGYGDLVVSKKWNISNDSILTFLNQEEKIIKYNNDTIWLINKKNKLKSTLIKVQGDLNIE